MSYRAPEHLRVILSVFGLSVENFRIFENGLLSPWYDLVFLWALCNVYTLHKTKVWQNLPTKDPSLRSSSHRNTRCGYSTGKAYKWRQTWLSTSYFRATGNWIGGQNFNWNFRPAEWCWRWLLGMKELLSETFNLFNMSKRVFQWLILLLEQQKLLGRIILQNRLCAHWQTHSTLKGKRMCAKGRLQKKNLGHCLKFSYPLTWNNLNPISVGVVFDLW